MASIGFAFCAPQISLYAVSDSRSPIGSGGSATESLGHSVDLARRAEQLGYLRYWFAEHHGMPGIASSSPEILIEHIASATSRIRVGSGGIMLPNHAPLRIAEAFTPSRHSTRPHRLRCRTGAGHRSGDVARDAPVRRRTVSATTAGGARAVGVALPQDHPFHRVRVVPSGVTFPPVWILGSSGASARFAGSLGVGYAFARHFSPAPPEPAVHAYSRASNPRRCSPSLT